MKCKGSGVASFDEDPPGCPGKAKPVMGGRCDECRFLLREWRRLDRYQLCDALWFPLARYRIWRGMKLRRVKEKYRQRRR